MHNFFQPAAINESPARGDFLFEKNYSAVEREQMLNNISLSLYLFSHNYIEKFQLEKESAY